MQTTNQYNNRGSIFSIHYQKLIGVYLVILMFASSFNIRREILDKHISYNHTWVTAQTLMALENYKSQGALKHFFRIIQTYPEEGNRFVKDESIRSFDKDGVGYYSAFPPFAVIFPYIIFSIFKITINFRNIQVFNMFLHLVSSVFLFLLIFRLATNRKLVSALISSSLYIFFAPNLWYFSATYSWDILWYYLWILGMYINFKISDNISLKNNMSYSLLLIFGLTISSLVYTEFQGLFLPISSFIYFITVHRKSKSLKKVLLVIIISTLLPLTINFLQNSTISGDFNYFKYIEDKPLSWSIFKGCPAYIEKGCNINLFFLTYEKAIFYVRTVLIVSLFVYFIVSVRKKSLLFSYEQAFTFLFILYPLLVHYIVFYPDALAHEFSILKLTLLLSIFIGLTYSNIRINKYFDFCFSFIFLIFLLNLLTKSVSTYKYTYKFNLNDSFYNSGKEINKELKKDEVGFIIGDVNSVPPLTYYAKRNLELINSDKDALDFLKKHGMKNGKIFSFDENYYLLSSRKISIN